MVTDLIIDSNFILNKLVYALSKNNMLFGGLHNALEVTITNYRKMYPFSNVYLVSDSRGSSWRKSIDINYKATRKKDSDIDWEFVFGAYDEFKTSMKSKRFKVLESPGIEGDDFISYLVNKSNSNNRSTVIITNDYDIKQKLGFSIDPLYINIISNEMYNNQKVFLPNNFEIFLNHLNKMGNDLFEPNDNGDFITLINGFIKKCEIVIVDPIESLVVKLISGDKSDNISSVWSLTKNGKTRGIGDKGAQDLVEKYKTEFGELNIDDKDLYDNIADLIVEKKKLNKSEIDLIKSNIDRNMKLIYLGMDNIPVHIIDKMKEVHDNI
jgi:5'-3' exonuclease